MMEKGAFLLQKQLGRGATAQVYLAVRRDAPTEPYALKVFHPGLWDREDLRRRIFAEFKTVSSLKHPNIIRVVEALWDLDPPAVVMEYIDGVSLEEFQNRLPYVLPEVAVLILIEVLEALEYAHSQGVIHRDLKPANILVGNDGRVVVGDFGLAKMADVSRLTLSGTILGSPDFMSPEQAKGELSTPRSDVFSAAAVLYFLVTGTRPFSRHSPLSTLAAVVEAQAEPAQRRNPKLSPSLAALIHQGLAQSPSSRFGSAGEFATALRNYLDEVGLTRDHFTFAEWIAQPTETSFSGLKRISESLVERAERQVATEEWEEVLRTLSHLSLVAPESAAIPRLMSEFETRRVKSRRRRTALAVAACAAVLASGGAYVKWSLPSSESPEKKPVTSAEPASAPASAPAATSETRVADAPAAAPVAPTVDRVVTSAAAPASPSGPGPASAPASVAEAVPARPRARVRAPAPASAESLAMGRVEFDVPDTVRVFWDGKPMPGNMKFGQRPGTYTLRLEKEGMSPITQTIKVTEEEPTVIRVR